MKYLLIDHMQRPVAGLLRKATEISKEMDDEPSEFVQLFWERFVQ